MIEATSAWLFCFMLDALGPPRLITVVMLEGVPGNTQREKAMCALAIGTGCVAATVATVAELRYRHSRGEGPRELTTNGLLQPSIAAGIFLLCSASCLVCLFLYYWFHFRGRAK